eukprot:4554299-Lingulodinium_polyedra.AAC.1
MVTAATVPQGLLPPVRPEIGGWRKCRRHFPAKRRPMRRQQALEMACLVPRSAGRNGYGLLHQHLSARICPPLPTLDRAR